MLPQRLPLEQMAVNWAQALDPIIANPLVQGQMISASLINGVTTVNHRLGRKMQGWYLVDINAAAMIYRSQPLNNLTLTLTSNAAAQVTLWVF